MRILITGASGLLGINLALEAARQHRVYGQVNSHPIETDQFTVLQANLLEPGAMEHLLEISQPDWVIHCAALANLEDCERDPELARELNTEVPRDLASLCRKGGARFLHVSTDAVFDGQRGSYIETDLPNPLSIYAQTKLAAEQAVSDANPEALIGRVNLFGWSLSAKRSLAEFFFYRLQAGEAVMGFTDVYFCPLLANDLGRIFLAMLEKGLVGLYHVLSPQCISKYDFGVALAQQFGLDASLIQPTSVQQSGLKAARSPNLTLKIDKLMRDLGDSPPSIFTGLARLHTLYQQGYPQYLQRIANQKPSINPL
ncbi:MAG: SDR family oxidoreductase [Anaerolineales bacterium]|nr:SDR family oxidoreductase [Anaerolineales bacterium]